MPVEESKEEIKILYVWIDKYKCISKQGFNLDSKYIFKFDGETLEFKENENYVEDFFSLNKNPISKISSITGLVGENGSGKSSLIESLMFFNFSNSSKDIIVYSKTIDEETKIFYSGCKVKTSKKIIYIEPFDILPNTNIIYIDQLYKSIDESYNDRINQRNRITNHIKNISTNFFLENDWEKFRTNGKFGHISSYQNSNFISEISRKINFIEGNKIYFENSFSIKAPSYLKIKNKNYKNQVPFFIKEFINNTQENRDYKDFIIEIYKNIYKRINNIIESFNSPIYKFKLNFLLSVISKYILDLEFSTNKDIYKKNLIDLLIFMDDSLIRSSFINLDIDLEYIFKNFLLESFFYNKGEIEKDSDAKLLESIKKFFSLCEESKCLNENELCLKLDKALEFLELSNLIFNRGGYFDFYFSTAEYSQKDSDIMLLSSGEENALSLFSRFYELFSIKNKNKIDKDNVLVIIDECELTFHPEWQRKFIYNLINFIEHIPKKHNFQIIITSHSPFIVSDLPHENIIIMKNNNENEIKDKIKNMIKFDNKTFASDISKLFQNSFFLDNTIGQFATEIIKNMIDKIQSKKKINKKEVEKFKKIINKIGEPFIRKKLLEILEKKYKLKG